MCLCRLCLFREQWSLCSYSHISLPNSSHRTPGMFKAGTVVRRGNQEQGGLGGAGGISGLRLESRPGGRPLWEAKGGFGCRAGRVENPEQRLELLPCCPLALPWPLGNHLSRMSVQCFSKLMCHQVTWALGNKMQMLIQWAWGLRLCLSNKLWGRCPC